MHWCVTAGNVTFEAGGPTYETGDVLWAGAGMAHGPIHSAGGAVISASAQALDAPTPGPTRMY